MSVREFRQIRIIVCIATVMVGIAPLYPPYATFPPPHLLASLHPLPLAGEGGGGLAKSGVREDSALEPGEAFGLPARDSAAVASLIEVALEAAADVVAPREAARRHGDRRRA